MEVSMNSLDVVGYNNQHVPTIFITQSHQTQHLGIILPGYRYSVEMAPLYYAARILLEQGADVLRIEYAYYRSDFMKQPESEQNKWISSDVFAACNNVLSQHPYEKITLIGKSLGTVAMGHLLADNRFHTATCVWETPLLTVEWLRSRIEETHPHSLFVIGTADKFYKPDVLKHLQHVTKGKSVVIEGANHALEIPGDISKSLRALSQLVQALQEFLNEDVKNA